jgi:hypothetical protein
VEQGADKLKVDLVADHDIGGLQGCLGGAGHLAEIARTEADEREEASSGLLREL